MLFNLNYGACIATVPPNVHELHTIHVQLVAESPKTAPCASNLIFEKLRNSLIDQYYSQEDSLSDSLFLLTIKGQTHVNEEKITTEAHMYYFFLVNKESDLTLLGRELLRQSHGSASKDSRNSDYSCIP